MIWNPNLIALSSAIALAGAWQAHGRAGRGGGSSRPPAACWSRSRHTSSGSPSPRRSSPLYLLDLRRARAGDRAPAPRPRRPGRDRDRRARLLAADRPRARQWLLGDAGGHRLPAGGRPAGRPRACPPGCCSSASGSSPGRWPACSPTISSSASSPGVALVTGLAWRARKRAAARARRGPLPGRHALVFGWIVLGRRDRQPDHGDAAARRPLPRLPRSDRLRRSRPDPGGPWRLGAPGRGIASSAPR